jgi:hypothetical protein
VLVFLRSLPLLVLINLFVASTSSSAPSPSISRAKYHDDVLVIHLRDIKVLHLGIVMFLDVNFILGLGLGIIYHLHTAIPLLHC